MRSLFLFIIFCTIQFHTYGAEPEHKLRSKIVWIDSSRHFVTAGGYARIKKLNDGRLIMVYDFGHAVWCRFSIDIGETWTEPTLVARSEGYHYTNAELIELQNGDLLYAWNARPLKDGSLPYVIKTILSHDQGRTWVDEQNAYIGDTLFINGVWEPSMLQLPSGQVQLYFSNESVFRHSAEQNITMLRSADNGRTWYDTTIVSFRIRRRDGMPVPLYLKDGKGIVLSIEDQRQYWPPMFRPSIIHTSEADDRHSGTVTAKSPDRCRALKNPPPLWVYAGAPYIVQVPDGETILSVQSTQGNHKKFGNGVMQVYIGDADAKHFSHRSLPFPHLPRKTTALWNSLTVLDNESFLAVSEVNELEPQGIWIVTGILVK